METLSHPPGRAIHRTNESPRDQQPRKTLRDTSEKLQETRQRDFKHLPRRSSILILFDQGWRERERETESRSDTLKDLITERATLLTTNDMGLMNIFSTPCPRLMGQGFLALGATVSVIPGGNREKERYGGKREIMDETGGINLGQKLRDRSLLSHWRIFDIFLLSFIFFFFSHRTFTTQGSPLFTWSLSLHFSSFPFLYSRCFSFPFLYSFPFSLTHSLSSLTKLLLHLTQLTQFSYTYTVPAPSLSLSPFPLSHKPPTCSHSHPSLSDAWLMDIDMSLTSLQH